MEKKQKAVESVCTVDVSTDSDKPTHLEEKIIQLVEYYFGDGNLPGDFFMLRIMRAGNGWLPVYVLAKFHVLRSLSNDKKVIIKALQKSCNKFVEVSADGQKVRRNPEKPLPAKSSDFMENLKARSVYLQGFPLDSTVDELVEFFKDNGNIMQLRMRRVFDNFDGNIFITFGSVEEAQEFMKGESLLYENFVISKELSSDYHAKTKADSGRQFSQKKQSLVKHERDSTTEEVEDTVSNVDVRGCILELTGLCDQISEADIRETFVKYATIAYVDYFNGDQEGYVRFKRVGGAVRAFKDAQIEGSDPGKIIISGTEIKMRVFEGSEEEEYWTYTKTLKDKAQKRNEERRQQELERVRVKGAVLMLTGIGDNTTRDDICNVFCRHVEIRYLDYFSGEEGYVRFMRGGDAVKALKAARTEGSSPATVTICGKEVNMHVLEGSDEVDYWKMLNCTWERNRLRARGMDYGERGSLRGRGGSRGRYRRDSYYVTYSRRSRRGDRLERDEYHASDGEDSKPKLPNVTSYKDEAKPKGRRGKETPDENEFRRPEEVVDDNHSEPRDTNAEDFQSKGRHGKKACDENEFKPPEKVADDKHTEGRAACPNDDFNSKVRHGKEARDENGLKLPGKVVDDKHSEPRKTSVKEDSPSKGRRGKQIRDEKHVKSPEKDVDEHYRKRETSVKVDSLSEVRHANKEIDSTKDDFKPSEKVADDEHLESSEYIDADNAQSETTGEKSSVKTNLKDDKETVKNTDSNVDCRGCILKLTGLGDQTNTMIIRNTFRKHAAVVYVDYIRGDEEGYIRFSREGSAFRAFKEARNEGSDPGTVTILDKEVTMRVLEGTEEEEYWIYLKKVKNEVKKKRNDEWWEKELEKVHVKGAVLMLSGLGVTTTRNAIQKVFSSHAEIAFVDCTKGKPQGNVRFRNEGDAKKALEAAKTEGSNPATVTICGKEVKMCVLEGSEEVGFWMMFNYETEKKHSRQHDNRSRREWRGIMSRGPRSLGSYRKKYQQRDGDHPKLSKKLLADGEHVDGNEYFAPDMVDLESHEICVKADQQSEVRQGTTDENNLKQIAAAKVVFEDTSSGSRGDVVIDIDQSETFRKEVIQKVHSELAVIVASDDNLETIKKDDGNNLEPTDSVPVSADSDHPESTANATTGGEQPVLPEGDRDGKTLKNDGDGKIVADVNNHLESIIRVVSHENGHLETIDNVHGDHLKSPGNISADIDNSESIKMYTNGNGGEQSILPIENARNGSHLEAVVEYVDESYLESSGNVVADIDSSESNVIVDVDKNRSDLSDAVASHCDQTLKTCTDDVDGSHLASSESVANIYPSEPTVIVSHDGDRLEVPEAVARDGDSLQTNEHDNRLESPGKLSANIDHIELIGKSADDCDQSEIPGGAARDTRHLATNEYDNHLKLPGITSADTEHRESIGKCKTDHDHSEITEVVARETVILEPNEPDNHLQSPGKESHDIERNESIVVVSTDKGESEISGKVTRDADHLRIKKPDNHLPSPVKVSTDIDEIVSTFDDNQSVLPGEGDGDRNDLQSPGNIATDVDNSVFTTLGNTDAEKFELTGGHDDHQKETSGNDYQVEPSEKIAGELQGTCFSDGDHSGKDPLKRRGNDADNVEHSEPLEKVPRSDS